MVVAICPKCRTELAAVGQQCPNDGWFGVCPEALEDGNRIVGRPLGGSFVALKKLGQGGMGTVYEGKQIQFERTVAIKVLSTLHMTDEQVYARFDREAKSIARVVHPNVVQLIDSGIEEDDIAYIVMEYVRGVELSNIPEESINIKFIMHVAHQVLNALAEAHAMNVIHRDLKPDNIMVTQEDGDNQFVKVLDFGLAVLTDSTKITMSGQALGTPWYMSPEQATATPVTESTDIYSLGCILYELVSSKPPFPGNRPYNVMLQHVNAQVPALVARRGVKISSEFNDFIFKCLEKAPENRYQTANEALEALHNLPDWASMGAADTNLSIRMGVMQLSELNRNRSESGIEATVRSDVLSTVSPRIPSSPKLRAEVPSSGEIPVVSRSSVNPVLGSQISPSVADSGILHVLPTVPASPTVDINRDMATPMPPVSSVPRGAVSSSSMPGSGEMPQYVKGMSGSGEMSFSGIQNGAGKRVDPTKRIVFICIGGFILIGLVILGFILFSG